MRVVVVSEFGMSYRICPRGGVISTEDSKVCFNFLVDPFHFSVRLEVIGSREGEVVVKELSEFLGKG